MMLHYLNTIYEPQLSSRQMKKPFDVLAEGLLTKNSRGDWTPIELFGAVVEAWDSHLQACLMAA